jgi:hypothetical protein
MPRAMAFNSGTPVAQLAPSTWSDVELELFLQFAAPQPLRARMAEVDAAFGLSMRNTPPTTWLIHAANASYSPAMPAIERVLLRGGPNGTITQLYNALRFTPANRTFAAQMFAQARKRYHPNVEAFVAQLVASFSSMALEAA